MSGPIRDIEKSSAVKLDAMRRKQERELKFTRDTHQAVKSELAKSNEIELVDLQDENVKRLTSENAKKEKLLEGMRSNLNQTKELTEKELKGLESNAVMERNKIQKRLADERERISGDHEIHSQEIDYRFNNQAKKLNTDGQARVSEMDQHLTEHYSSKEADGSRKLAEQHKEFSTRMVADEQKFKNIKQVQDKTYKKERVDTNNRQTADMSKLVSAHEVTTSRKSQDFERDFKDQQLQFEKRFTQMKAAHEADLKRLNELNGKVSNTAKSQLAQELMMNEKRSQDTFYQFVELKPVMKDLPDSLEVKVPIAEHSKADLMMSVNGKAIVFTFNRRYVDGYKNPAIENRINKVESMTSKLATNYHLDPKSVKSHYENGFMTYTIKKA